MRPAAYKIFAYGRNILQRAKNNMKQLLIREVIPIGKRLVVKDKDCKSPLLVTGPGCSGSEFSAVIHLSSESQGVEFRFEDICEEGAKSNALDG